jgi:hypothetical protein
MNDSIEQIAIHEAGHALAHVLTGLPFSLITIDQKRLAVYGDGKSLGYLQPVKPYDREESDSYSKLFPYDFFQCFSQDLTVIAGYVAQRVFTKGFDKTGSKTDMKILYSNRMMNHPEPFRSKYRDFLITYTFMLFQMNQNKIMIWEIANELLKHKTLSYDQINKIVKKFD